MPGCENQTFFVIRNVGQPVQVIPAFLVASAPLKDNQVTCETL